MRRVGLFAILLGVYTGFGPSVVGDTGQAVEPPEWFTNQFELRVPPPHPLALTRGTAPDWRAAIDATWGASNLTATERIALFNDVWTTIDQEFGCFQDLSVDWDAIYARYIVEVGSPDLSRGRFHAIMNQLALSLRESHTFLGDDLVEATALQPGVPLLVYGGWGGATHFGAGLTPLPDKSLLVYRAVASHPLGLEPGDVVLGYGGRPWSALYQELLAAELPMVDYWWWGSSDSSFEHSWLMSGGMNWHLFDTIDVMKHETNEIRRLSTAPLDGASMSLTTAYEELPVPGVPFPDLNAQQIVSWGIVDGTRIGYIYVQGWFWQAETEFRDAVWDLVVLQQTDGIIVDFRTNYGGNMFLSTPGMEIFFNTSVETIAFAERCDPDDHLAMCPSPSGPSSLYVIDGDPATYYDKPIAVLVGPGAVSSGDQVALRFKFHPEARFFGKSTATAFNAPTALTLPAGWGGRHAPLDAYLVTEPDDYLTHDELAVDCPVWLTQGDVAGGRDSVVAAAIDWILGQQDDPDLDGFGGPCDNCPDVANLFQFDTDGDGSGDSCDCAPSDAGRFPGAVEVHDGIDNQCPGEPGAGMIDEITPTAGFRNESDRNELSWPAQPGAAQYEIVRSERADFSTGCWSNTTDRTYWVDPEDPTAGIVFHYLVRVLLPGAGSWGAADVARDVCP